MPLNLFASPVVRVVGTQLLAVAAQAWVAKLVTGERRSPQEEAMQTYLQRLEALSRDLETRTKRQDEEDTASDRPHSPAPTQAETPPLSMQDQREDEPYSRYAPDMHVSTACLPCTRAHLAMVAGSLDEALRFAREDGVGHPEVTRRLGACGKDLVVLERYDLAPDKIAALPQDEQAVVRKLLPRIRKLRQQVLNQVQTVEDLERVATEAEELYWQALQAGKGQAIDWQQVERELFGQAEGAQEVAATRVESVQQPPPPDSQ